MTLQDELHEAIDETFDHHAPTTSRSNVKEAIDEVLENHELVVVENSVNGHHSDLLPVAIFSDMALARSWVDDNRPEPSAQRSAGSWRWSRHVIDENVE